MADLGNNAVFRITFPPPHIGTLLEQPLERLFAESLTGLRQGTVREQGIIGQAFGTDIEAPSDLGDGLITEKGNPHDELQDHIRR